jgi:DNA mismatch repair protein MutS
MAFRSILFDTADDNTEEISSEMPAYFVDLNLGQVVDAITAGREEYDLKPFFFTPLRDGDAIRYRQEVMRELEDETLMQSIKSFCQRMAVMYRHLGLVKKLDFGNFRQGFFLEAAEVYCQAVTDLADALSEAKLKSRGFVAFREFLGGYVQSDGFTSLVADTRRLKASLSSVKYGVIINGLNVRVRKYEGESDYTIEVQQAFEKFKQGAVKDYQTKLYEGPVINYVGDQILNCLARLYPDIFASLDDFYTQHSNFTDGTISGFERQIQFYIAYLDFVSVFERAGLKFCYPQVSSASKEIYDYDGFDLALANKLIAEHSSIVGNDFYMKGQERILVVSGPNQSGKTTFARAFGQAHYLASLGCSIPGREARLFLFDKLFTLFEKAETIQDLRGKLEDDLVRIHDILGRASPNSIIIINEVFSSTTLADAVFLSRQVMERLTKLDILVIWVTFVEELASFNEKTVSMVGTVDPGNPVFRTFRIVRKAADGLSYALAIAEKHRVTYESLKGRIRP